MMRYSSPIVEEVCKVGARYPPETAAYNNHP